MSATRARGPAIAALALWLVASPGAAAPPASSPGLPSLVDEFVTHRLERAPFAARSRSHAEDPVARTVAPGTLDQERAWLRGFRARLDALGPAPDPAASEAAAERAMLSAAVRYDSLVLEVLRPYERDPGAYVALIAGAVAAPLDRSSLSPCKAVVLAIRRLEEVPELLRTARVNLVNPPRVLTERAIERYQAVLRFYRADLPRMVTGCRAPHTQADFAAAETLAVRAVEVFLTYLERDLLPASHGELAIGRDACQRLIEATLMAEAPPLDSLLAESTGRVEARRAELDSLTALGSGADARVSPDSLTAGALPEGDAVALGKGAVERVREFLQGSDLVTLRGKPGPSVRRARAIDPPDEITLAEGDCGEPREGPAWIGIPGGDSRGRWESDLAVAAAGIPGRLMRELSARGDAGRLGRATADVWPGEDWGQYCERMLIDMGYGSRDPRYRLALASRALLQAGRSLASLALHAGAMSPEEARRMLEERCLLAPEPAEREMRSAASDAALMGYTIGAQRLLELQEEAWRRLGPRLRTRSFNDAVLRCGVAPYGFVRARLWHELAVAAGNDGAKP